MPFTPFHFGPGAALHAIAPRQLSFIAFCTANVLIDIEPLYYMLTDQYPLHRFCHTYIGALLVALATFILFVFARWLAGRFRLPNPLDWQQLQRLPVAVGTLAGTCSHILLDSLMHDDIKPFAPFSYANPLWRAISLDALHWLCVGAGLGALCLLWGRQLLARR